jgi:hypothetical protein
VNIFQNPKGKDGYAIEINNRFEVRENMGDDTDRTVVEKWESIETLSS